MTLRYRTWKKIEAQDSNLEDHRLFAMVLLRILMFARRQRLFAALLFTVLSIFFVLLFRRPDWSIQRQIYADCPSQDFILALARRATPERFIILAMVDAPFVDMAVNLYEASFRPFGIESFLFVGAGRRACEMLSNRSLPCFHYTDDKDTDVASVWGSANFIRKMNIRTDMIIDALNAGFTVLQMDLDIVFLKNPVRELMEVTRNVDIAALWDSSTLNAGFLVVRPTRFSKLVYERTKAITLLNEKVDDQNALNAAIKHIEKIHKNDSFKAIALDRKRYLCGLAYYEYGNRYFASPCTNCAVVHNNWIVSREAKVYRFKEHLMWHNDEDEYYSSTTRGYITYNNPIIWPNENTSITEELEALKAALAYGQLLNRVVILPRFHCSEESLHPAKKKSKNIKPVKTTLKPSLECPLNSILLLAAFDAIFAGRYRENSFLSHPLVPDAVKRDQSVPYLVVDSRNVSRQDIREPRKSNNSRVDTDSPVHVDLNEDLISKLASSKTVLRFHSLYQSTPLFPSEAEQQEFNHKIDSAFVRGRYRQL